MVHPHDLFAGVLAIDPVSADNVLLWRHGHALHGGEAYHHRHVLIVNLDGVGSAVLDQTVYRLKPGQAILVFPYQYHHYADFSPEAIDWLFMTFDTAPSGPLIPLRNHPVRVPPAGWQTISNLLDAYVASRHDPSSGRHRETVLLANLLLEQLLAVSATPQATATPTLTPAYQLVQQVCTYVHAHTHLPLAIHQIASDIRLSESRLRTVFRETLGISLGRYIRQMRVRAAQALIAAGELNMTQIAERCGYESLFAFSRGFKRETGKSPTGYRRWLRSVTGGSAHAPGR